MIKDLEQFKRESSNRHKSERNLDKNLYQFNKKVINEKVKELNSNLTLKKKYEDNLKQKQLNELKVKKEESETIQGNNYINKQTQLISKKC